MFSAVTAVIFKTFARVEGCGAMKSGLEEENMEIRFILSRLFKMNLIEALSRAKQVAVKAEKSLPLVLTDMVWCGLRYGAGPADYALFEFWRINGEKRKTYVTRSLSNALIRRLNTAAGRAVFGSKAEFDRLFAAYIGREWIELPCSEETLSAFVRDKPLLFYKPLDQCCGRGVERLDTSMFHGSSELSGYLSAKGSGVLEEALAQHPQMCRLYPDAVNTVRIVTIFDGKMPETLFTYIRIGSGGRHVDNFNNGGMMAPLNPVTGCVVYPAVDKAGLGYSIHPQTGCSILGFEVPFWEECIELVHKAAMVVSGAGYIGWDVAVTPSGPVLIEGNAFPGYDIYQMPSHLPEGIGLRAKLLPFLKPRPDRRPEESPVKSGQPV